MDIPKITNIPSVSTFGQVAISQRNLLVDMLPENSEFRDNIKLIANSIVSRAHLTLKEGVSLEKKKKKLFGLIPMG